VALPRAYRIGLAELRHWSGPSRGLTFCPVSKFHSLSGRIHLFLVTIWDILVRCAIFLAFSGTIYSITNDGAWTREEPCLQGAGRLWSLPA
jgi:hypothetical protein